MSVYSTLFAAGSTVAGFQVVYTVPALMTVVVRDIEVTNLTALSGLLNVSRAVSGTAQQLIWRTPTLPTLTWAQWAGRTVLNPGDEIGLDGGSSSGWTYLVSGYLLTH